MTWKKFKGRDVAPFLKAVREFLLGRKHDVLTLRFANLITPRTRKHPKIPPGSSASLSNNRYYNRDGRREVKLPINVMTQKALPKPGQKATFSLPTPGKSFKWD